MNADNLFSSLKKMPGRGFVKKNLIIISGKFELNIYIFGTARSTSNPGTEFYIHL